MPKDIKENYGTVELSPTDPVIAGTYQTWTLTYTVGSLGMDDGSSLKFAYYMTSDFGLPQFDDPTSDNYCSVETTGDASLNLSYDPDGGSRPYKPTIDVDVYDGALKPGETITLTLGDRSEGSMGMQAQSFVEANFRFVPLVDPIRTGEFVELPMELSFDVIPGHADDLVAVVPSYADVEETVDCHIRAIDYWGNVAEGLNGELGIETPPDLSAPDVISITDGVATVSLDIHGEGVHRVAVSTPDGDLTTTTNPLVVDPGGSDIYWGDIHGQSGETVGTGTVWDYFEFGRDRAFLDFAAHAGNDFQIDEAFWSEIKDAVEEYNEPGEFVTFPCYEWSANTPNGGDHNVYFKGGDPDLRHSSSWLIEDENDFARHVGTFPVEKLYDTYEDRDDVLIIPHQGGRPATLDVFDPDLSPFLELVSVWGVFEWFGHEALEQGYPVGFVGGSDDHTGRPGATSPANKADFTIDGGLMAAQTDALDRDALWDAFTDRRVYATTGARIILDTSIAGASMGQTTTADGGVEADVSIHGTAPLQRVDLFRGNQRIATQDLGGGEDRITVTWSGSKGRIRHKTLDWSGGLTIDRGQIRETIDAGFDHPNSGIQQVTDTAVRWTGETAGNYQSIGVEVDAPDETHLSFNTEPVSGRFQLDALDSGPVVIADRPHCQVTARREATATDPDASLTLRDPEPPIGEHAYYIRVRQADGEMAWSSPTWVTNRGTAND